MKRLLPDTSIDAYRSIESQLSEKQKKVVEALKALKGNATNEEIADHLQVGVHTIAPRTGELMAKGVIQRGEKAKTKSNREAYKLNFVVKAVQLSLL